MENGCAESPAELVPKASSSTSGLGAMAGDSTGIDGSVIGGSFGSLMSQARPSFFSAQIPYQFTSISYQVRPCLPACGAAWGLLCQPSPKVRIATQKLFVDASPVMNR